MRYAVYTLRRTSSRTVYAIYDTLDSRPVCDSEGRPRTFTDRTEAQAAARELQQAFRQTVTNPGDAA